MCKMPQQFFCPQSTKKNVERNLIRLRLAYKSRVFVRLFFDICCNLPGVSAVFVCEIDEFSHLAGGKIMQNATHQ